MENIKTCTICGTPNEWEICSSCEDLMEYEYYYNLMVVNEDYISSYECNHNLISFSSL